MNGAFYIGATGLDAQQTAVEIVANNVTNMNTAGYKRATVSFAEMLVPAPPQADATRRDTTATLAGVNATTGLRDFTPAELHPTGNAMDVAIRGAGFIPLSRHDDGAQRLWRGGTLHVGADGYLSAPDGTPLDAMVSVPRDASSITLQPDGEVLAVVPGSTDPVAIGRIDLVMVNDASALTAQGAGIYTADESATTLESVRAGEDNAGSLAQGYGEASNVQLSDELVSLMVYQRAYAANARLVQVGDELMSIANGLKR
jgi:flagellar basal-body rod protein FlgG